MVWNHLSTKIKWKIPARVVSGGAIHNLFLDPSQGGYRLQSAAHKAFFNRTSGVSPVFQSRVQGTFLAGQKSEAEAVPYNFQPLMETSGLLKKGNILFKTEKKMKNGTRKVLNVPQWQVGTTSFPVKYGPSLSFFHIRTTDSNFNSFRFHFSRNVERIARPKNGGKTKRKQREMEPAPSRP